jgi:prepilin-type N-terminal cleavage/methylation domain-containing protein
LKNLNNKKALSLVEMMIAVILFGVMSMVGFKYYKSFYNSGDITKKTNLGAVIDQASQLSNAFDIYEIQVGKSPTNINNLIASNVNILTSIPEGIQAITGDANTSRTWKLTYNGMDIGGSNSYDTAFVYPVAEAVSPTDDHKKYCRLFNNIVNNTLSIDANIQSTFKNGYSNVSTIAFCATHDSGASAITDDNNMTIIEPGKMYIVFPKNMPTNLSSATSSTPALPAFSLAPSTPTIP